MSRIAQEKRIDVKKELSSEVTDGCVEGKHTLSLKLRSRIRNQQLTANSNENEQTLDNEQAVMPGRKRACVISSRELTNSSSNMDTAKSSSAECACKEQHEKFQNEVFGILKNILLEVKSLKSTVPQVHVPQECESSVVPEQLPACPLATMNDLVEMEFMLQDNENFQSLSNYLSTIGGTSKKDVMRRILRSLISNPLAITLNWKGQRGNKTAFSEMKNTVRLIHSATQKCLGNEKVMAVDIEECIKKWLMRASDREGGRAGRKPSGIREHDNMMWSDGNNM